MVLANRLKLRPFFDITNRLSRAKDFRIFRITRPLVLIIRRNLKNSAFMVLGIASAGLGLKGFLLPNGFIDGGVIGLSILASRITGVSTSILFLIFNIPFIALGFHQMGRWFALRTALAVVALAVTLVVVHFPVVTTDKLLTAVFGGFFIGGGIGLTIRGSAMLDGTDVLALFISRKISWPIGDIILVVNTLIFLVAAVVLGIETALYSILAFLAASKTVDFIIQGIEEYTGVTIITEKSDQVRHAIIHSLKRGVTLYKGQRGFGSKGENRDDIDIVFTVVTRLEIAKLKVELERIDETAFIVMHPVSDIQGGMVKRRALH